ncbi:hypothetical protein [Luteimonas panaciterrae]|uniref:hypothetical protein n=1 Tax=Luteimonas panaciterrae TaxID=363885 RepID=UPI001CFC35DA|nr:hypothetical protein [Luteimonas panaciterrae]
MTDIPSPAALRSAASRLVAVLGAHEDPEYRLAVLKRLARRMGEASHSEAGYPLFLRVLGVIAESDDEHAKRLLAETFGTALRRMDMPGGALNSWGATRVPDSGELLSAGPLSGNVFSGQFFGATPQRMLGPVEYLTVWYLQRTQRISLGADAFRTTLSRLIALFNHSDDARALYPQKLAADAQNELEGAYTRATRERLATIAAAWKAGKTPEEVAEAAVEIPLTDSPRDWVVRDL